MQQKREILRHALSEFKVDGILITDIVNVRYISGFTGSSGFVLITKDNFIFATDFRYQEQAKIEVKGFKIKLQKEERTEFLKRLLYRYKIQRLGFEEHNINYATYKKLRGHLRLKPLTDIVETLRITKSQKELSLIRTAIGRAENAFMRLQPFIKAGITEQELAIRLEGFLREEGCKKIPFEIIVASGPASALPHAKPTSRIIKKGDLVLFDWSGECEGYYADITRMVAIEGKYIRKQLEIYDIVSNAQERVINAIKPDIAAAKVDTAGRDFIRNKGYNKYFGHGTGHGVGLAVHEKPIISWQSKDTLKKDMVFTVEPGIYLPGLGGVRIEDMVVVTKYGAEVLTTLPRRLHIIRQN